MHINNRRDKARLLRERSSLELLGEKFRNVCLIDALRILGAKVDYVKDGPFWARNDGNEMLSKYDI